MIETGALKITVGNLVVDEELTGGWRAVVVIGFIAGFLERAVPSLIQGRLTFARGPKAQASSETPEEPASLSASGGRGSATKTSI